jgi:hypothetical protein
MISATTSKKLYQWSTITAACLIMLVYSLGTGSTSLPKWIALVAAAAAIVLAAMFKLIKQQKLYVDKIDVGIVLLCLWAWLSLFWSPDPMSGLQQVGIFTALIVLFLFVRHASLQLINLMLPIVSVVTVSITLIRIYFWPDAYGGFGNENYVTEILLMISPFLVLWWRLREVSDRWVGPILLTSSAAYLFAFNQSRLEFLVVPVMAIAWAVVMLQRLGHLKSAVSIFIGLVIVAGGFLATAIKNPHLNESVLNRAEIYTNSTALWLEKPVRGHGVGGFKYEYPRVQQRHATIFPQLKSLALTEMFVETRTAHNEFSQFLIELGLIGFGIAAAVLFLVLKTYFRHPPDRTMDTAFIACVAVIALAMMVFPFHNPATAFFATICLATISRRNPVKPEQAASSFDLWQIALPRPVKLGGAILGIVLVGGWSVGAVAAYMGGLHLYTAEVENKNEPGKQYAAMYQAYKADPLSPTYRRNLFVSLVRWAKHVKRLPVLKSEFDRIYKISLTAGPQFAGVLFSRIEYLEMLPKNAERSAEIERLLTVLKKIVPLFPEVHIYDAQHAIRSKDMARARSSIDKAEALWTSNKRTRQLTEILRKHLAP